MSNREIASILRVLAELIQLHNGHDPTAKSLAAAAYQMSRLSRGVIEMNRDELDRRFSKTAVSNILQIKKTGTSKMLEELIQLTPAGLFEMMRIKGLGGKKLSVIWKKAGIDNLEALLKACRNNELIRLKGFGEKIQQSIISSIEGYKAHAGKFHLASVSEEADKIIALMRRIFKTDKVCLCGEIRRRCNVVEKIEVQAAITVKKFNAQRKELSFLVIEEISKDEINGHTINETPFVINLSEESSFGYDLFSNTGSKSHILKVLQKSRTAKKIFETEKDVYKHAGLPFIPPELREDLAEWDLAAQRKTDQLVRSEDIRGVVHNHTTWSDGIDTLKNFVAACIDKGFEYAVISDHSKNAFYAGGLKEDKILRQHEEIKALNKQVAPFKIFKSIEADILVSGSLDFDDSFLKRFDLVIVSIHQLLKMDEEKATRRLLKAIENPYTTILGHVSGRKLLIRHGYPLNYKKIIDACAANNVIIEMNANPYRLDMDYKHIPYAIKKGVMISVNPDAHSIGEIDNIRWGIASARKGGLTKEMTWNAMSLAEIEKWLKKRRRGRGI